MFTWDVDMDVNTSRHLKAYKTDVLRTVSFIESPIVSHVVQFFLVLNDYKVLVFLRDSLQ